MKQLILLPASVFAFVALFFMPSLNAQQPNPKDFAVPDAAFRDIDLLQFGGKRSLRSNSFSSWLGKTEDFGQLVALHDQRDLNRVFFADGTEEFELSGNDEQERGSKLDEFPIPNDRVCDIAYTLLRKNYNVKPLDYRYSLKKRDELIATLIARIRTPVEDREFLIPKPKPAAKE